MSDDEVYFKDLYAVKYRSKDSLEWIYAGNIDHVPEASIQDLQPRLYLHPSFKAAKEMVLWVMSGPHHLAEIKISCMNRYNLRLESEVLFYKEFK